MQYEKFYHNKKYLFISKVPYKYSFIVVDSKPTPKVKEFPNSREFEGFELESQDELNRAKLLVLI